MDVEINRFVNKPTRLRKFALEQFDEPFARGRRAAFEQEGKTVALVRFKFLRELRKRVEGGSLRVLAAFVSDSAVGVVKIENRCLCETIRAAIAVGML